MSGWNPGTLLTLTVAVLIAACGEDKTSPFDTDAGSRLSVFVPTEDVTLARESYSGVNARERLTVQSRNEWSSVWARIHGTQSPVPPIVEPDFDTEVALVAAMGEKPSGGFTISIDSITRHERGSIVYVTEKSPGESCITPAVLTQAVHAIRAPKAEGMIWWREQTAVENC